MPTLIGIQPDLRSSVFYALEAARIDGQAGAATQGFRKESRLIESAVLQPALAQRNRNDNPRAPALPHEQFLQPGSHLPDQPTIGAVLEVEKRLRDGPLISGV